MIWVKIPIFNDTEKQFGCFFFKNVCPRKLGPPEYYLSAKLKISQTDDFSAVLLPVSARFCPMKQKSVMSS